ncbi:peptidylprolyl isomerase [Limnofasciculus baicalensis]|uniref:Peptidyl-prolyl cis-trans isomerase n=1 Tax=Limnofasciculus baicalensis BBK-W-15 TaxID=2699891 RepID=A0AAE3KMS1_9CYAN|nr:peptidylprolyl isomerase [Limnofasciculus baicalensis]MCP2729780.1 peptidylprolyl isomerase [Limnofasciculus baicalensis BBK-W-15]
MQIAIRRWLLLFVTIGSLILGACSTPPVASLNASDRSTGATTTQANNPQGSNLPKLEGKATVVLKVKGAPITIEVDGTNAPITAGNFVDLVQRGVYNGTMFHRVVRQPQPFVVQGGDPQGKDPKVPADSLGTGSFIDPDTSQVRYIPLEIKPKDGEEPLYSETFDKAGISKPPVLKHTRGAVAMARSSAPDSASAQFYFALADLSFLDGNYAVFGYVTEGMDIVDKIQIRDRIDSAEVIQGGENLKK